MAKVRRWTVVASLVLIVTSLGGNVGGPKAIKTLVSGYPGQAAIGVALGDLQCAGATSRCVSARFRPMHIYFVLSIELISSGKAPD